MAGPLHTLLARQLKRHPAAARLAAEAPEFLRAVEAAYKQADDDRALLERSLELTSQDMARDLDELRRAKEALIESRAFLEKAQEVAQLGSWVASLEGSGRLLWSRECLRIFGLSDAASMDFASFMGFVHPDDRPFVLHARETAIRGEATLSLDYRIVRSDGALRWVHSRADLIRDATGAPVKLIGVLQDVTEHRELDDRLRQSQKLEAVGRLAGGVAHDFNNILTAVKGYSAMLKLALKADSALFADVEEIEKAADRAALLTRQLLAFSRKQVLVPEVINVNDTVSGLEAMLRCLLREDVELVTRLDSRTGRIKADPGQLSQVLMNLVVNARDAMPDGGRLVIETSDAAPDESPLGVRAVRIVVSDNGVGMTPDVLARIYEPFFTTKAPGKGTGLGLSTVHGIVNQSGGHIAVDSLPGRGTRFKVHFPLLSDAEQPAAVAAPEAGAPRGSETILVVEDEDSVRTLICRTLCQQGYRVLAAAGGDEALKVFSSHPGRVDMLVTDVIMPGMHGRALAEKLAALSPQLRLLYISGYTDDVIAQHGVLEAGTPFLQKPFSPHVLARRIRTLLAGPRA